MNRVPFFKKPTLPLVVRRQRVIQGKMYCAIDILMVETGFTATLSSLNNHNSYQTNNQPIKNEQFLSWIQTTDP